MLPKRQTAVTSKNIAGISRLPAKMVLLARFGSPWLILLPAASGDQVWAHTLVLVIIGLYALWRRPISRPPWPLLGLLGVSWFLTALSLLPSTVSVWPSWRSAVASFCPGASLSPQPVETVHELLLFGAILALSARFTDLDQTTRLVVLRSLAVGLGCLALVATAVYFERWHVPGWHPVQGFGPFANRNQTGALMGLGVLLNLGLIRACWPRSPVLFGFGLLGFTACLAALTLANSRAAWLLAVAGVIASFLLSAFKRPAAWFVAAGMFFMVAAAAFSMNATLMSRIGGLGTNQADLRRAIWADTVPMVQSVPWTGVGLGNFHGLFPRFRTVSLSPYAVLHPESDWLWLMTEGGIPATIILLGTFCSVLGRRRRSRDVAHRRLIGCAHLGAIGFLCHSLVDVPGHRLGCILPAILVTIVCTEIPRRRVRRTERWLFRSLAALAVAAAGFHYWCGRTMEESRILLRSGQWAAAQGVLKEAVRIWPLEWSCWSDLGCAQIALGHFLDALRCFRIASQIEPKMAVVPFVEGKAWFLVNAQAALGPFAEALRRSQRNQKKELYAEMLDLTLQRPELRADLLKWARRDADLATVALRTGSADSQMLDLIENASELDAEDRKLLWRYRFRESFQAGAFRYAYELAASRLGTPPAPKNGGADVESLHRSILLDQEDWAAGFELAEIYYQRNQIKEAAETLLPFVGKEQCPIYVIRLYASLLAEQGQWRGACEAIERVIDR